VLEKLKLKAQKSNNAPVDNSDPIAWIEQNFYIPELNGPIQLMPYHKAVLREAFSKDEAGNFKYNLVVWGDIKKSIKSSIAAANALYRGYHLEWGSIKIIANDLKQADSRVAFYLRRAIEMNPGLNGIKQTGYKTVFPNHTTIEAIPIDPSGEAGGNDDLIVFSELWAAKHKAMEQMWTEMTLSPTKFGRSQRWIETYAGFSGESPILERLYERGIKGEHLDLSYTDSSGFNDLTGLEVYATDGLLMLWNTVPRCPWQTQAYYDEEEATLLPTEFVRVHRNQWASSTSKFVERIWWDACYEPLPPLTKDQPAILAVDASKGSEDQKYIADCFAVVMVTRHPSNSDYAAIRYCGIWQAERGKLLDYEPIEDEIKRLCSEFSIVELAYDPHQLHDMMTRLKREGVANTKEFNQGAPRLKSDRQLRDIIINRRIAHDGNPLLTQHIDNANVVSHGEEGIRLIKRQDTLKIDAAVALSMAVNRCYYFSLS
jgi:phage terminase large subunit-like protein